MKPLMRVLVIGTLAGCTTLCAQNFNGGDDFSSVSGNWSAGVATNSGTLSVSGGVLNFSDNGLTTGQSSSAASTWTLNTGSYVADWQAQLDLTLNLSPVAGEFTSWTLSLANSGDSTDNARITFLKSYSGSNYSGVFATNSSDVANGTHLATVTTATVRASYVAATHQLTLAFSEGAGFTDLVSAVVDGSGLNWGMGTGDSFVLSLRASNGAMALGTGAISSGFYADNFLASSTAAVPEPATYAAGLGVLALLAAGLRRRFAR